MVSENPCYIKQIHFIYSVFVQYNRIYRDITMHINNTKTQININNNDNNEIFKCCGINILQFMFARMKIYRPHKYYNFKSQQTWIKRIYKRILV